MCLSLFFSEVQTGLFWRTNMHSIKCEERNVAFAFQGWQLLLFASPFISFIGLIEFSKFALAPFLAS